MILGGRKNIERRGFLQRMAALALPAAARAAASQHSLTDIGVQLYTVRDVIEAHPAEVLRTIEQIGYREVEVVWASMEKISPALHEARLKPVSIHLDTALFHPENREKLSAAIPTIKQRGFQYMVCPYVPPQERGGADRFQALADTLNRAGAECRKAGLQLCYHNHAFDFQPMGNTTPIEILLNGTSKDTLALEMDMFWVSVAGHDPVEMLKKYAGRVPLMHIKDKARGVPQQYSESVPPTAFQEAGHGILNIPAILRAASDSGVKHYFVEQDRTPGDPIASLRASYEYLSKLKF